MRFLSTLVVAALACGLTPSALGDTSDYRTNVLDPVAFSQGSDVFTIETTTFAVIFTPCVQGELPGGITADGCFAGINHSGLTWDGLSIMFPNTRTLNSQPASCAPATSDNIFSSTHCALSADKLAYFLDFSDGIIPSFPNTPADKFFIIENGVPALDFPHGTVTASVLTPEPASLALMLTGLSLLGGLLYGPAKLRNLLS